MSDETDDSLDDFGEIIPGTESGSDVDKKKVKILDFADVMKDKVERCLSKRRAIVFSKRTAYTRRVGDTLEDIHRAALEEVRGTLMPVWKRAESIGYASPARVSPSELMILQ